MGNLLTGPFTFTVPSDVEHTLIWTRLPIFHPELIAESISRRVEQDGLWGFTGNSSPPPSPSTLPSCLPALSEWGVTMEKLVRSEKGTEEEETLVRRAGKEVDNFVRNLWTEANWETAWFVNPPVSFTPPSLFVRAWFNFYHRLTPSWQRLQSVPELAHIHVFARQKPA